MSLVSKLLKNELYYDITKDGFLFIIIPKSQTKYYNDTLYYNNICFDINTNLSERLYTIKNTYYNSDDKEYNNISLKELESSTLSIKQFVLLLKNLYPDKYNNLEHNNIIFLVEIK